MVMRRFNSHRHWGYMFMGSTTLLYTWCFIWRGLMLTVDAQKDLFILNAYYFDGIIDSLYIGPFDSTMFKWGTGSFTVDFWINGVKQ